MTRHCLLLSAALLAVAMTAPARAQGLRLGSPDIDEGETVKAAQVFNQFGCHGQNISPALSWSGAPSGTKSFALSVFDTDAPTGSGFWHWTVWNIPPSVTALPRNAGDVAATLLPPGALQGRNDYSLRGYGGPCPPPGDTPHHYVFTLFATDLAALPIGADPSPAVLGFMMHFHALAKATLTGRYGQ